MGMFIFIVSSPMKEYESDKILCPNKNDKKIFLRISVVIMRTAMKSPLIVP